MLREISYGSYLISNDNKKLDTLAIHNFLKEAYWCKNIPYGTLLDAIKHSLCYGVYLNNKQIGFARMATDYATFAYLMDVYILNEYRGQGISKELMIFMHSDPLLKNLRKFMLTTSDAQFLYEKLGYSVVPNDGKVMHINKKDFYLLPK